MTSKEAIKDIRYLINEFYSTDEDKNGLSKSQKQSRKCFNEYCVQILKDLELLEFLIEKMYVAGGLIELKVCPPNNYIIPKYHNNIETHDKRFFDFIDLIHDLKYNKERK